MFAEAGVEMLLAQARLPHASCQLPCPHACIPTCIPAPVCPLVWLPWCGCQCQCQFGRGSHPSPPRMFPLSVGPPLSPKPAPPQSYAKNMGMYGERVGALTGLPWPRSSASLHYSIPTARRLLPA